MRTAVRSMILALVLAACSSTAGTTKRDNLAYLYGKGGQVRLSTRVYHTAPDRSTLYYKVPTKDLLYKSDGSGGAFAANLRLRCELFAEWNSRSPFDSISVSVQDLTEDPGEDKELIGSVDLRRTDRSSFVMRVTVIDMHRDNRSTDVLRVERGEGSVRQWFLPTDPRNGLPLFDDHLLAGTTVKVRCEALKGRTLHGAHHGVEARLPAPVFTTTATAASVLEADSGFVVQVDPEDGSFLLSPRVPGVYHLRPDPEGKRGFTLFVMDQTYPYVANGADMLRPLRYITSMQEYERISASNNVRQAVERFWLDAAGDRERAREAIRIFYTRVENANRWFTGHVEGWRTDRGLVHIIFGTPSHIYRSDNSETWIYGEENNLMSLTFNFTRRSGPYTDNDFALQRDPALKGAWYRNVESWRNGRVYQN